VFSRAASFLLASTVVACEPELVVGSLTCTAGAETAGDGGAAGSDGGDPGPVFVGDVSVPWSTSFEEGFCDYRWAGGFCYSDPDAGYEIVTEPVRTGRFAAAFKVTSDPMLDGTQARCVRQGVFPSEGYYGAYYYVPSVATNEGNWNLFHFQGGTPGELLHGLWDVSIRNEPDGALSLYVFDFFDGAGVVPAEPFPIPIGEWFHVEVHWKRAPDATGELALYQDGRLVVRMDDRTTDDTEWGQWYVGNLADALMPAGSTIYVDDVTIRGTP
jgi:hypothetical protein